MKKLLLPVLLLCATVGFLKAQVNETFEGAAASEPWAQFDGTYNGVVNNPAPNVINSSAKCGSYTKSGATGYSLFGAIRTTAINLTTNSKFTMQVYSTRKAKFILKLEGSKGAIESTKKIVVTGAWQEYTFDFSAAKTNDSLKKIFIFFDAGNDTSKGTFFFDNLKQLPADACAGTVPPTTQFLIDDFECQRNASYLNGWDSLTVIDNPDKTGANTSAKCGKYLDTKGEPYANLLHDNFDPLDLKVYNYFRIKVWAAKAGLLLLKLEDGGAAIEVPVQITQLNKWVEYGADFSDRAFIPLKKIVMFFNAGVDGVSGDTYYVDDIRMTEKPPLEDFEPAKLTWTATGANGTFAVAANPVAGNALNPSPNSGKYTKGTAAFSTLTANLPVGFKMDSLTPQLNMMVYAPTGSTKVTVQLVSALKGNISADAPIDSITKWTELKFDFTAAVNVNDISKINILFDGGVAASGAMYFFDNIRISKLTLNPCKDVVVNKFIMDDFECQRNGTVGGDADRLTAVKNPAQGTANPSALVGKYIDRDNDQYNALGYTSTTALDLSKYNQFSMKLWSPKIVPMTVKLEGGTSPGIEKPFTITKTGEWITYNVDFSDQKGKNHKNVVIFFNFAVSAPGETYYIDDIQWKSEPITGCVTDFETPTQFKYFANGALDGKFADIINNPKKGGINTSAKVMEFKRVAGAERFAGGFLDLPAPIRWTNAKIFVRAKMWTDHIGNFAVKLEGSAAGPNNIEVPVANKKVNEWEEITCDFTGKATGAENYTRLTMFVDLLIPADPTPVTNFFTAYLDDIVIGDGAGCGAVSGIFDPIKVEALSISPNPATNELSIRNTDKIRRLEVTNMMGQRLKTIVLVNSGIDYQTISLEGLSNGIYILSAFNETGLMGNTKFVKE